MAEGHDAWDWDSVLDELTADTPPPLPLDLHHHPNTLLSIEELASGFHESSQNAGSERPGKYNDGQPFRQDRVRKKDPRLNCPNFLAGRIPCSCPEVDDEPAAEIAGKRAKMIGVRCQVPGCREDISHLKEYHRRHRVCLQCANSGQVILNDDQLYRYCQQCGKFHLLSDFDEGKRSCRRKLERHNNRRRRKPSKIGETLVKELTMPSSDTENHRINGVESNNETELQLHSCRKEKHFISCDPEQHCLKHSGNVRAKIKSSLKEEARASSNVSEPLNHDSSPPTSKGTDELCQIVLLMDENVEENGQQCSIRSEREQRIPDSEVLGSSISSAHKDCIYASPCPTGRISFKLFDWNPADFPRALRQQILEWLASMPVELESYIRPGCTVLTYFMTMPRSMWNKLDNDWSSCALRLFGGPQCRLWGGGYIIARMNNNVAHIHNGNLLSGDFEEDLTPILSDVFPLCVETGCTTDIFICGSSLFRTKSRFLVSFRGLYLEPLSWELVESHCKTEQTTLHHFEICKITVCSKDSEVYGPAYVEVDHDLGTSNYIPILIADKETCAEVNSLNQNLVANANDHYKRHQSNAFGTCGSGISNRQTMSDILVDLGLVLVHFQNGNTVFTTEKHNFLILRLQRLLSFFVRNGCHYVTDRLLQIAKSTGAISKLISVGQVGYSVLEMDLLCEAFDISLNKLATTMQCGGHNVCWHSDATERSTTLLHLWNKASVADDGCLLEPENVQVAIGKDASAKECHMEPETVNFQQFTPSDCISLLEENMLSLGKLQIENSKEHYKSFESPVRTIFNVNVHAKFGRGNTPWFVCAVLIILTICTGMCLVLQHPHKMAEFSMSFRRCLWGSAYKM